MTSNFILIFVSILLSAVIVSASKRLSIWLALFLTFILLTATGVVAIGITVSVERLSGYSNYTARYLEYSRELRIIADEGDLSKLRAAIVYFDTRIQADSQSPDILAGAVQAIRTGDFIKDADIWIK